jgi:hypothetical protein
MPIPGPDASGHSPKRDFTLENRPKHIAGRIVTGWTLSSPQRAFKLVNENAIYKPKSAASWERNLDFIA